MPGTPLTPMPASRNSRSPTPVSSISPAMASTFVLILSLASPIAPEAVTVLRLAMVP